MRTFIEFSIPSSPEGLFAASWLRETALRLFPDNPNAKEHSGQANNLVEKRARALCAKLARVAPGTPMEYRMVRLMARVRALDYETADAAIAFAIQKGWLIGEGEPPRSVCLTNDGRATSRRRGR